MKNINKNALSFFLFLYTLISIGCHKNQPGNTGLPTLTTDSVIEVTPSSVVCYATITSIGNTPVTSRGICWSTSGAPTFSPMNNNFYVDSVFDSVNVGSFETIINRFYPNTTFYIRAFASNRTGVNHPVSYGRVIKITTSKGLPSITSFTPTSDTVGGSLTVYGSFYSLTGVTLSGVDAPFILNSDSSKFMILKVPPGASSGVIKISNPYGTATSTQFTLLP
jgi:hypothetical protein